MSNQSKIIPLRPGNGRVHSQQPIKKQWVPPNNDEMEFLRKYRQSPKWKQQKVRRLIFILQNGGKRAERISNLINAGQIEQAMLLS
jgi:hypothetical protein